MSHAVRHRRLTGARLLLVLAAFALVAAACGDDDDDVASSPTTTSATATTAAGAASTTTAAPASSGGDYGGAGPTTTAAGAAGTTVAVEVSDSSLGQILTVDGKTVYAFTPDTAGVSTCYDACADNWPALTGEATAGEGLDASLFATAPRTDGTTQVTVDGHPLYYFAADAAPGDTNGQGVGDKWYVVGADGALIKG